VLATEFHETEKLLSANYDDTQMLGRADPRRRRAVLTNASVTFTNFDYGITA
jgi:hypothetical protein